MTYIVTSECVNCKHTTCVPVCPTESFHEGPNMLVINPDECIDCGLCVSECPVNAIYAEESLPHREQKMIKINAELSLVWPTITESKEALGEAELWKGKPNKLTLIEREIG